MIPALTAEIYLYKIVQTFARMSFKFQFPSIFYGFLSRWTIIQHFYGSGHVSGGIKNFRIMDKHGAVRSEFWSEFFHCDLSHLGVEFLKQSFVPSKGIFPWLQRANSILIFSLPPAFQFTTALRVNNN